MGLSARIKQFIDAEGVTAAVFERSCGLSNGAVSKMGEGTRRATLDRISTHYPLLNINWLLTGEGQMLKPTPTQQSSGDNSPNVMGNNNMVGNTIATTQTPVTGPSSDANVSILQERIKSLEAVLQEKERLIKVLLSIKTPAGPKE